MICNSLTFCKCVSDKSAINGFLIFSFPGMSGDFWPWQQLSFIFFRGSNLPLSCFPTLSSSREFFNKSRPDMSCIHSLLPRQPLSFVQPTFGAELPSSQLSSFRWNVRVHNSGTFIPCCLLSSSASPLNSACHVLPPYPVQTVWPRMTSMPRGVNGREDPYGESAGSALLDAINRSKVHLARFILDANDEDTLTVVNTRDFKGKTPLIRSVYITVSVRRQAVGWYFRQTLIRSKPTSTRNSQRRF